jgi:predicted secreted Zn-dependent protease
MTPRAKAQQGLKLIFDAMLDLLAQHPNGLSHADIARALDLEMEYHGGKNYPSQTILHQLVYAGSVEKVGQAQNAIFRLKSKAAQP